MQIIMALNGDGVHGSVRLIDDLKCSRLNVSTS